MEEASNFDPNAFWNDGSCVFEAEVAFNWTEGFKNHFNNYGIYSIKLHINDLYITTLSLTTYSPITPCNVPSDMINYIPSYNYHLFSNYSDSVTVKVTTINDSLLMLKRRFVKAGCNSLMLNGN